MHGLSSRDALIAALPSHRHRSAPSRGRHELAEFYALSRNVSVTVSLIFLFREERCTVLSFAMSSACHDPVATDNS